MTITLKFGQYKRVGIVFGKHNNGFKFRSYSETTKLLTLPYISFVLYENI